MGAQRSARTIYPGVERLSRVKARWHVGSNKFFLFKVSTFTTLLFVVTISRVAFADGPVNPHVPHPLDWMYQLPVGEVPGWRTPFWVNLETSESNVWNRPTTLVDRQSGQLNTYEVDYQMSIAVLDAGFEIAPDLAFAVELPYARRHPGNSDEFIEDWHAIFAFYNYQRSAFPDNRTRVAVTAGGVSNYDDNAPADGLSSVKLKLKKRLLGADISTCPCGLAVSLQANLPLHGDRRALSSGTQTWSALLHAGLPIGSESGLYLTTGFSMFRENRFFSGWPMHKTSMMGDASLDIGIMDGFGVFGSMSAYSPWMRDRLDFVSPAVDPKTVKADRLSSGFNSLLRWRGYQTYGVRYRWGESGDQFAVYTLEDWGLGDYDDRKDVVYTNNSPDVLIGTQLSLRF